MNISQLTTRISSRHFVAAGALWLACGLAPAFATDAGGGNTMEPHPLVQAAQQTPRHLEVREVSASRINGRIDWDIDYPSQLAPQSIEPARSTGDMATASIPPQRP